MKHPILHHLLLGALLACADAALAERYPLSVRSCEREVTFERAPSRAVSHDINLTEMMVALGLQTRMVGYTGISGWWKNADPGLIAALKPLPELVARYPTAETLLDVDADFFFAGWGYGMRVGGDLTPASLEPLGVKVYELSESCAQIGEPRRASLDELYRDLRNLGRIFDVEPRAERLVASLQARIERARAGIPANTEAPRVFLYDSGEDRPFTSGRLGMPQALIEAAGG
ncbi:ABC transporter substrate-binding protein, partial [Pseudomonas aeruginosa]